MPRYFFHYRDGVEYLDHEGTLLAGPKAARAAAVRSSGEAIRDLGEAFWDHPEWTTWVTDESGANVCSFRFAVDPGPT
ncbi:DUF6894 family protein [uncultured Enterovirga sp.]|uniref:DUF6894 family protein n=1 Tax=uncultured Enterovirga sp. TaxID=2026352 RepID=UPI0035CC529C